VQTDLFAAVEHTVADEQMIEVKKPSPVLEHLQQLDVDSLTPRQALEALYHLKEQLDHSSL
ncbi:hypothetical protein F8N28_07405, partial [Acinetobacter soli]